MRMAPKILRQIPSKYFFAPINTGFSHSGSPSQRLLDFHRIRSGPSLGVSYVGNVSISEKFVTNPATLVLSADSKWRDLSTVIKDRGSLPGIQLACRNFSKTAERRWSQRNKQSLVREYSDFILELSRREIDEIFAMFVDSSRSAYASGFLVLQIHAAHGYFLSSLLSPALNKRRDSYSVERSGGLPKLAERIKSVVPEAILDFRISCYEGIGNIKDEWLLKRDQSESLFSNGVEVISLSAGMYDFTKPLIYPSKRDGHLPYLRYAEELAQRQPQLVVNVAGNFWDWSQPRSTLDNVTYAIGRPLIADPEFVLKYLEGRRDDITHCDRSGDCHYYTKGNNSLCCGVNNDI